MKRLAWSELPLLETTLTVDPQETRTLRLFLTLSCAKTQLRGSVISHSFPGIPRTPTEGMGKERKG